jgi:hypothetical protein
MFIGVVGEVNEENEFNGKILLKRISENKILNRTSYQNNYHHDREINDALKVGGWRELYLDDPTILTSEFLHLIVEFFNLDDTGEYLCLHYMAYPNGVTLAMRELVSVSQDCCTVASEYSVVTVLDSYVDVGQRGRGRREKGEKAILHST